MGIFVMIGVLGIAIPFIVELIKKLWKAYPAGLYPVLPFVVGIILGVVALVVRLGPTTIREAIIFGIASGGVAINLYDIYNGIKSLFEKPVVVEK